MFNNEDKNSYDPTRLASFVLLFLRGPSPKLRSANFTLAANFGLRPTAKLFLENMQVSLVYGPKSAIIPGPTKAL